MEIQEIETLSAKFINLITKIGFVLSETYMSSIQCMYIYKNIHFQILPVTAKGTVTDYIIHIWDGDKYIKYWALSKYNEIEKDIKKMFPHKFRQDIIKKLLENG